MIHFAEKERKHKPFTRASATHATLLFTPQDEHSISHQRVIKVISNKLTLYETGDGQPVP